MKLKSRVGKYYKIIRLPFPREICVDYVYILKLNKANDFICNLHTQIIRECTDDSDVKIEWRFNADYILNPNTFHHVKSNRGNFEEITEDEYETKINNSLLAINKVLKRRHL